MSFELGIIVRTSILWVCCAMLVAALRKGSASSRHAVWMIAMLGALVLPLAALLVPAVQLSLVAERAAPPAIQAPASTVPLTGFSFSRTSSAVEEASDPIIPAASPDAWILRFGPRWLWAVGFLILMFRLLNSTLAVNRAAETSRSLDDAHWQSLLSQLKREMGLRHPVQLRLAGTMPPMTWGLRSHTILLPDAALQWTAERRRAVLLHELAHVKRRDGLLHLVVQAVCAIYWFNPLAWYAARQLRIERERACDDYVLNLGTPAEAYAHHLLQIASGVHRDSAFAAVTMANPSQLEARLVAILDSGARRRALSRPAAALLISTIGALTLSVAAVQITSVAALAIPAFAAPPGTPALQAPAARASAPSPAAATSTEARIEGTVTDSAGKPIPGAIVIVCDRGGTPCSIPGLGGGRGINSPPSNAFSGTTDTEGKFKVGGLPAGIFMVNAAHNGFSAPYLNSNPQDRGTIVTLSPGSRVQGLHLELAETTSISGKIVDTAGNALAALRVRLLRLTYDRDGVPNLTALGGTVGRIETDDRGDYRFFGITPGTYYVGAVPSSMDASVVASYYPGAVSLEQASAIEVRTGGETTGINFTMTPWKQYTVRFKIGGTLPPAVTASSFQLRPRSPVQQPPVYRAANLLPDGNGVYVLRGVPPGSFDLIAAFAGAGPDNRNPPQHFEIEVPGKDVDLGTLMFKSGVVISGRLTMADRTIPQAATISLTSVGIVPANIVRAQTLGDGSFILPVVGEGRYMVSSTGPGMQRLFFSEARYAGRNVLGEGLLVDGLDHGVLELVLDGPPGSVHGVMLNNRSQPIVNAQAVLIPAAERRWNSRLFLDASTDQSGRFSISGVAPGDYSVLAWERPVGDAYKNAGFVKEYLARAVRVSVSKGAGSEVINLRPIPTR